MHGNHGTSRHRDIAFIEIGCIELVEWRPMRPVPLPSLLQPAARHRRYARAVTGISDDFLLDEAAVRAGCRGSSSISLAMPNRIIVNAARISPSLMRSWLLARYSPNRQLGGLPAMLDTLALAREKYPRARRTASMRSASGWTSTIHIANCNGFSSLLDVELLADVHSGDDGRTGRPGSCRGDQRDDSYSRRRSRDRPRRAESARSDGRRSCRACSAPERNRRRQQRALPLASDVGREAIAILRAVA